MTQSSQKPNVPEDMRARWQRVADLMAKTVGVPAGLIMRVDPPCIEVFVSSATSGNPYTAGHGEELGTGLYCERVMVQRCLLHVPDARRDPEWDHNPDIELGMVCYLGYPIEWPDGEVFGTICVLDARENPNVGTHQELMAEFQQVIEGDLHLLIELEQRKRTEDMLGVQRDLGMAIAGVSGLDETLRLCVDAGMRIPGMDCAGIYLVDETTGGLSLAFHKGLPPGFVAAASHYAANSAKARLVMAGKPIYTRHDELDVCLAGAERSEGLQAIAVIPVRSQGQVVACLNVASHSLHRVPDSARDALEAMATHIGDAIVRSKTEDALRQSEGRYRTLVELALDVIYRLDEDGTIAFISPAIEQLGYDREALIGTKFEEIVHPDDRGTVRNRFVERRVGDRTMRDVEVRLLSKTGSLRDYAVSSTTVSINARGLWDVPDDQIERPDKTFLYTQGIARDITERKETERALTASEERLRRQQRVLVELTEAGAIGSDLEAAFPKITEAAARGLEVARTSIWLYNQDRSAIRCLDLFESDTGRHSKGLELAAADYPAYFQALGERRNIAADGARSDSRTAELADGYLVPLGITSVLDSGIWVRGEMDGVVCHEHVGPLRRWTIEEESFARSIADFVSLAMEANHRRRAEDDLRRRIRWAEGLQKAGQELAACKTVQTVASVASRAPVERLDLRVAFVTVPDSAGRARLMTASSPEIWEYGDDLGCANEVLRTQQSKLVPDTMASPPYAGCRDCAQHLGFRCCATIPILVRGRCVAAFTACCDEVGPQARLMQAAPMLEVFCRQVGHVWERCQDEEELHKLWRAVEHSPASVVITDIEGTIEYVNPKFTEVTGYSAEEAIGQNPRVLKAGEQPREFYEELWHTILSGETWEGDFCNRKKSGEVYWEQASISPIFGPDEEITHFVAVKEDITERRRIQDELHKAKEVAEAASRAKSAFLANMSHEIRTPMNAILGFAQLMQRDTLLTAEQRGNVEIILRSGEHLLALINEILEMSKIEAGRVTLNPAPFDVHGLLDDLEVMFAVRTDAKHIELAFERGTDVPRYVIADENKLRQVLINLLGNAVKFTDQGGVALKVSRVESRRTRAKPRVTLRFEVEDTGVGIAAGDLDTIFDPFEQATKSAPGQSGTGLGLAISREYVRLMGGDIAASGEPGKGSVFTFHIDAEEGSADGVQYEAKTRRVAGLADRERAVRVLVADDKESNRRLLSKMLAPLGFEVSEAEDGEEAVRLVEEWSPHLVLMDLSMPVLDGHEATRRIKANTKGRRPVVIAVSASAFEEDSEAAISAGADDFLGKPFKESDLLEKIRTHLGVEYVYEEEEASAAQTADTALAVQLSCDDLAGLPADLLGQMAEAATKADLEGLNELIGQVEAQDAQVARALRSLADSFDYDALLDLLQPGDDS